MEIGCGRGDEMSEGDGRSEWSRSEGDGRSEWRWGK